MKNTNLILNFLILPFITTLAAERLSIAWDARSFKSPASSDLIKKLTPEQYQITQSNGTEPPFHNSYWDNHQDGIYVDIVSGEPLFSSKDKYDSGTGWPSFTRSLEKKNLVEVQDTSLGATRVEVRSKHSNSHLGHVFNDGPLPTGLRYCINSGSLRFIEIKNMKKEGYPEYLRIFDKLLH